MARAIDPERLFPDRAAGFWDAMDPRVRSVMVRSPRNRVLIDALLKSLGLTEATPAAKWTAEQWSVLLEGGPGTFELTWTQEWGSTKRTVVEQRSWPGLFRVLQGWSDPLDWLVIETSCPRCGGGRLRPELLAVRIGAHAIHQLVGVSVDEARRFRLFQTGRVRDGLDEVGLVHGPAPRIGFEMAAMKRPDR